MNDRRQPRRGRPILAIFVLCFAAGCGGQSLYIADGAPPVDPRGEAILLLSPAAEGFSEVKRTDDEIAETLLAAAKKRFRRNGIDLTPLRATFSSAGVGDMSRNLARAAYHALEEHDAFTFEDCCEWGSPRLPAALDKLVQLTVLRYHLDQQPRYLLALFMETTGIGPVVGSAECRMSAVLYDAADRRLHTALWYDETLTGTTALEEAEILLDGILEALRKHAASAPAATTPNASPGSGDSADGGGDSSKE